MYQGIHIQKRDGKFTQILLNVRYNEIDTVRRRIQFPPVGAKTSEQTIATEFKYRP